MRPQAPSVLADEMARTGIVVQCPPAEPGAAIVATVPAAAVGRIGCVVARVGRRPAHRDVGAAHGDLVTAHAQHHVRQCPRRGRRKLPGVTRERIGPLNVADHPVADTGKRVGTDVVGDRHVPRRIGNDQSRRRFLASVHNKVPVVAAVVVPYRAAVIEDHADLFRARRRIIGIGPIRATLGHRGIGQDHILPARAVDCAADVNVNRVDAHQVASGGIVRNRDRPATHRAGRINRDRRQRRACAAVDDVHIPVVTAVIIPHARAVIEHHVDLPGVRRRVIRILPVVAVFCHRRIRIYDVGPAVAPDMNLDVGRGLQRPFVRIVPNGDRIAA